jgi:SAM-dependent methyltransferase
VTPEQTVIPKPSRRADTAYLDFIEGIREFVLNEQDGLDNDIDELFTELEQRRGKPYGTFEEVAEIMDQTAVGPLRNRLMRTQQEMQWRRIIKTFESQRADLEAELDSYDRRGPGEVLWDPNFQTPEYANVHFHLQPGGYHKDPLAGYHYHYSTKVFFRGLNDSDAVHKGVAGPTPVPADGNVARVLDLGCSLGQSTTALKQKFPQASIWGIDHSAPMVRYAHKRAVDLDVDVSFAQCLAEDNGFPDQHFDLVYSMILFHEIPTRIAKQVLAEVARVLRPGGLFVVHDFVSSKNSTPLQLYHREYDCRYNGEPYAKEFCRSDFPALVDEAGLKLQRVIGDGYGFMNTWWVER